MDSETYRTQIRQALTDAIEALDRGDMQRTGDVMYFARVRYREMMSHRFLHDENMNRMDATPHRQGETTRTAIEPSNPRLPCSSRGQPRESRG
jgi:hypothetical protein